MMKERGSLLAEKVGRWDRGRHPQKGDRRREKGKEEKGVTYRGRGSTHNHDGEEMKSTRCVGFGGHGSPSFYPDSAPESHWGPQELVVLLGHTSLTVQRGQCRSSQLRRPVDPQTQGHS